MHVYTRLTLHRDQPSVAETKREGLTNIISLPTAEIYSDGLPINKVIACIQSICCLQTVCDKFGNPMQTCLPYEHDHTA